MDSWGTKAERRNIFEHKYFNLFYFSRRTPNIDTTSPVMALVTSQSKHGQGLLFKQIILQHTEQQYCEFVL